MSRRGLPERIALRVSSLCVCALAFVASNPQPTFGQGTREAPRARADLLDLTTSDAAPAASASRQTGSDSSSKPESTYERIWKLSEPYADDTHPVVQRVQISGRFQFDFAKLNADQGGLEDWNVRRLRIGPRITFFRMFLFHAELDLNPQEREPFYLRFTDFYLQWSKSPELALTVGKHGALFTLDGLTSSKDLLTIDRNNLSNNLWFPQEYIPGVSASGRRGSWSYKAGLYSAGEATREFGKFSGGYFTLGTIGYDLRETLGVKDAQLTGSYVYQQPDAANTFTRQLHHVGSVVLRVEAQRWGVRGDLTATSGYLGQSDLWGLVAMPFLNVTDKFQTVVRYTLIQSEDPNGIMLNTYENSVVGGRGDEYNELYLGASYYFYGHKLKLQSGLQYVDMTDRADDGGRYSGWSWTTGLRVGWP